MNKFLFNWKNIFSKTKSNENSILSGGKKNEKTEQFSNIEQLLKRQRTQLEQIRSLSGAKWNLALYSDDGKSVGSLLLEYSPNITSIIISLVIEKSFYAEIDKLAEKLLLKGVQRSIIFDGEKDNHRLKVIRISSNEF